MEPLTSNRSHTLNVEEAHRALVGVSSGLTRLWRVPGSRRTCGAIGVLRTGAPVMYTCDYDGA